MEPVIEVGAQLSPMVRETGFHNWNRYAAVNDEYVPIHMDDEAGRNAGYPTAFGMGNLQWAYLHNLLRSWMGETGELVEISCQFRAPNLKGQTVTAHGTVTGITEEGLRRIVDLDVWTEDQDGNRLAPGKARVVFPLLPR